MCKQRNSRSCKNTDRQTADSKSRAAQQQKETDALSLSTPSLLISPPKTLDSSAKSSDALALFVLQQQPSCSHAHTQSIYFNFLLQIFSFACTCSSLASPDANRKLEIVSTQCALSICLSAALSWRYTVLWYKGLWGECARGRCGHSRACMPALGGDAARSAVDLAVHQRAHDDTRTVLHNTQHSKQCAQQKLGE